MFTEARKRLFTVDEFHRMGEAGILDDDARLELLGGEIFEMPPIGPGHQGDVNAASDRLGVLRGRAVVQVQGAIVLDDYSQPLPDIAVLRFRDDFYRRALARAEDVLLVIEVADTSLRRDRHEKLPRYAASGIPEAWLFDVEARRLEVHREPSEDGYRVVTVHQTGDMVSPQSFPDLVIDVGDLLGD